MSLNSGLLTDNIAPFNLGKHTMQSMTAFAAQEINSDLGKLTCEIKSVNQRFLDLTIKAPDFLRSTEEAIRKMFNKNISRGKVSVFIRFYPNQDVNLNELTVNQSLLKQIQACSEQVHDTLGGQYNFGVTQAMNWQDVIIQQPADTSELQKVAVELMDKSVADLIESRKREGQAMKDVLTEKIDIIQAKTNEIREFMPAINQALQDKLRQKLEDFDVDVNPERFEQEVAFQLQRIDVGEEIDRLDAHVVEVKRVLELDEPVGRRLDFLIQELNRESNTIGSKSASILSSTASIDLKVAIEQMREQVQNIE